MKKGTLPSFILVIHPKNQCELYRRALVAEYHIFLSLQRKKNTSEITRGKEVLFSLYVNHKSLSGQGPSRPLRKVSLSALR